MTAALRMMLLAICFSGLSMEAKAQAPNGARCTSGSDCASGSCWPFAPNAPYQYCISGNLNCALPGTSGARFRDTYTDPRYNTSWFCDPRTGDWSRTQIIRSPMFSILDF